MAGPFEGLGPEAFKALGWTFVAVGAAEVRISASSDVGAEHIDTWRCVASGESAPRVPVERRSLLPSPIRWRILSQMVQYQTGPLDASFAALSDATRRGVLEQLGRADASITDLAQTFHMTLTGMRKHVGVLEQAELVTTEKVGRVRVCRLGPRRLEDETAWIDRYRQLWDARFDELDKVVEELERKEKVDGRNESE